MPRPTHPTYPTLTSDRVPDRDPAQVAAARRAVLRRYETGRLGPEEVLEVLSMLGLVGDEEGVA